ncbi:phosphoglycerate kinase, partial [Candidatus Dojkabacteria bacterium]|nr:phosphoglycerate kinase [Candidatus Dojkabacteria bacterium]
MKNIHYLSQHSIEQKRVIIRLDCDVPIKDGKILDDFRIRANIATINYLLERGNKLVCIAKLGRPEGRDPKFSLKPVADHLN